MKKWKTAITGHKEGNAYVRGYDLRKLIGSMSFAAAVYLVLKGKKASVKEEKMMDAILVSSIDHGIAPPSVTAARVILSGGNSMNAAVAGGVLTLGDHHGGAIEKSAKFMQEAVAEGKTAADIVADAKAKKKRLAGYGHKIYKVDPRTDAMLEVAKKLGFAGKYVQFALDTETALEKSAGRKLCLNVDGCIAALISEMGFDWRLGKGFFIIARTPGLVAHVHEEWVNEKPFRRLDEDEYEYTGDFKE